MTGMTEDRLRRTAVLSVRLTPAERDYVDQEAADAGMKPSEWVRGCIMPDGESMTPGSRPGEETA